MSVHRPVPFFGNTEDDIHCVQAVFRMLLGYYFPKREYDWAKLDQLTGFVPEYWTWPASGFLYLVDQGLTVTCISTFDEHRFASAEGKKYLREVMGKEAGDLSLEYTHDFAKEQRLAVELVERAQKRLTRPSLQDVRDCLDSGALATCIVNAKKLDDQSGYIGHMVVIIGYTKEAVIIHDPGLPPLQDLEVPVDRFETAWNDTGSATRELFTVSR